LLVLATLKAFLLAILMFFCLFTLGSAFMIVFGDFSDFERQQVVGACLAEASVTKVAT
jgi:hypothetical protein